MIPMFCPACGAEMSLETSLAHNELREVSYEILKLSLPEGALLLRYVSLFRTAKNKMRPARTAKADAGKITLPLISHGFLFVILAELVEKMQAETERAREEARRHGPRSGVNTGPLRVGDIDPALQKLKSHTADPMPEDVRKKLDELKRK